MNMKNMNYLLIISLYCITKVLSDSECGPVTNGFRSSNVCCHEDCSQCGEAFCSYEYDNDGNYVGTSEVSEKCCKSYIRRTNDAVSELPVIYCNTTNSAPCIIQHDDMVLFGYKYLDEDNSNSNEDDNFLSTTVIVWIVVGSVLMLGFCSLLGGYLATKCCNTENRENENDIEQGEQVEQQ